MARRQPLASMASEPADLPRASRARIAPARAGRGLAALGLALLLAPAARADDGGTQTHTGAFTFDWNMSLGAGGQARYLESSGLGSRQLVITPQNLGGLNIPFVSESSARDAGVFSGYAVYPDQGGTFSYTAMMYSYYQENTAGQYTRVFQGALPPFSSPANGGTYQYPYDGTQLCSLRVMVDQHCSVPTSLILNAYPTGGEWCVGWSSSNNGSCAYASSFGGLTQDSTITSLANTSVLEHAAGFVVAPPPGGSIASTCLSTGAGWANALCEEYVGGEMLVQANNGANGIAYSLGLTFQDRMPFHYNGTATFNQVNGECFVDVVVPMDNASACLVPPPPPVAPPNDFENIPSRITLDEPDSGCAASVITGFDGGCPVLDPNFGTALVGDYVLDQNGAQNYWYQPVSYAWTPDGGTVNPVTPLVTNSYGPIARLVQTRLDYTMPAFAGLAGYYYNTAYYDPQYYYPHQVSVGMQFPNGNTETILLPPTVSDTEGWSPAYHANDGNPNDGPGTGFFPNGTLAVADGGGTVARFNSPTGAVSGQINFSNCLQRTDISGATYQLVSSYQTSGSFNYPPLYETLYQRGGYGYPAQSIYTGTANTWLRMPLYSGAFHGIGPVGTYDTKSVSFHIAQDGADGGDYVNQDIAYALPGTNVLASGVPVVDQLPNISFGKLNVRIYVVNGGTRLPIKSAAIYNYGSYSLSDGGVPYFTGNYNGWGYGSSTPATEQIMHVVVPPGSYNGSNISVYVGSTQLPLPNVGPVTILPVPGAANNCVASCVDISDPTQGWLDDEQPPVISVDGGSLPPIVDGGYVVHAGSNISISGSAVSSSPVEAVSITATFADGGVQVFSLAPALDAGAGSDGGIEKRTQFSVPVQVACGMNNVDLSLAVTNKCGEFANQDLGHFIINGTDQSPTLADAGASFIANRGNTLTLHGTDPDNDPIRFAAVSSLPLNADGSTSKLDSASGVFTWTPPTPPNDGGQGVNCTQPDGGTNATGTNNLLVFNDLDFCNQKGTANVVINVVGDSAPYLPPPAPKTVAENGTLTVSLGGFDHDQGDTVSYRCPNLPSWAQLNASTGVITFAPGPTVTGTADSKVFAMSCTVSDNSALTNCAGPQELDITVTKTGIAPAIAHLPDQVIPEEQPVSFTALVTDTNADPTTVSMQLTDGDGVFYSLAQQGATLSGNTFNWVPTYLQAGVYTVIVTAIKNVADCVVAAGSPSWCQGTTQVKITVTNVDRAPTLDALADQVTTEQSPLSFSAVGHDADIPRTGVDTSGQGYPDHIAYSAVKYVETQGSSIHAPLPGLPPGMTLNATSGLINWTPALGQWGDYVITLKVSDDSGLNASAPVHIHVKYLNEPPAIASVPLEQGFENGWIHWVTGVTDPRSRPDTCSMTHIPTGASYDTNADQFSWMVATGASASSPYTVTTQCCSEPPEGSDPTPATACSSSDTVIDVLSSPHAPVLDPIPLQIVQEGSPLSFTVTATDPDGTTGLIFSATTLPSGAAFNAATQVFTWTPDYTQAGQYEVTFTVSDGVLQDSKPGRIQVLNTDRAPVIAAIPTVNATVGLPASFVVHVTDPDSDWTHCSLSGAPAGVSFIASNNEGQWTPGVADIGTAQGTVTCCDQPGFPESPPLCTSAPVNFVVSPAAPGGSLILAPEGPFTIYEGDPVGFPLTATETDGGPAAPLSCSITPLPTGSIFDGIAMRFSWTPDFGQAGVYTVQATCTDGLNSGSIAVKITVLKQIFDRVGGGLATAGCVQAAPGARNLAFLPLFALLLLWPRRRKLALRRAAGNGWHTNLLARAGKGRVGALAFLSCAVLATGCSKKTTGSLTGVLAISGGGDASGASVSALGPSVAQAKTDGTGTYHFDGLQPGTYALVIAADNTLEGQVTTSASVRAGETTQVALQTMTPAGSIAGVVSLGTATGNAGVVVSIAGTAALALTDDAGNYLLEKVPAGAQTIAAARAGRGSASAQVQVLRGVVAQAPLITLSASANSGTASLSGKIVLDGQPAPQGLPIGLAGPSPSGATTDATGSYQFDHLAAGQYMLTVAMPSAAPAVQSASVALAAGATQALADLHFTPLGAIHGRALLAGEAASNGIAISALGAVGIALTDAAGSYTLQGVPAGTQTVTATYPGRASASASGLAVPWDGTAAAPDLTLTPKPASGAVSGAVTISAATDAGGVQLSLTGPASESQTSAASGAFSFSALPDGLYALTATAPSTVEGEKTVTVNVQDGGSPAVALAFTGAGSISGVVTLNGAPAPGAAVFVEGGSSASITDANGRYTISPLAAGHSYSVTASAAGYLASPIPVGALGYAQHLQANPLVLLPEGASTQIVGTATIVGLGRVTGIRAAVTGGSSAGVVADADGGYVLAVPPGLYQLGLSYAGDGGSGYAASVPNVFALPGSPGAIFDDGAPWPLPASLELQWGKQIVRSGAVALSDEGGPDGTDLAVLLDTDCSAAPIALYGECVGVPSLVTGGLNTRFPFTDTPGSELGLGPLQGAGGQRTVWFLTGLSFDQSLAQPGSPAGTGTATLALGRSDGQSVALATIGLAPSACRVYGCTAPYSAPSIEAQGQGLAFTSQEADGIHVLLADASQWPPAVLDLGTLAPVQVFGRVASPSQDRSPDAVRVPLNFPYLLAPDGKHIWFRSLDTKGDLVAGPTSPGCASDCTVDVEAQVPGGILETKWFAFSADGAAASFIDGNTCSIGLTNGGLDAGTSSPGDCLGLWTARSDGSGLLLAEPFAVVGTQTIAPDPDGSGQLVASADYGVDGTAVFQIATAAPFASGTQPIVQLASSEAKDDPSVHFSSVIGTNYLVALGGRTSATTLLAGQISLTRPLTKITDSAMDWLVSTDGKTVAYRHDAQNSTGSLAVATQSADGGIAQAQLDSSGQALDLLGLAASGQTVYTDTTTGADPGFPLVQGYLMAPTSWATSAGGVVYSALDGQGNTLLRVAKLDGSARTDVADAGPGMGGQFNFAVLSPDGAEVAWSLQGNDLSFSETQLAAPVAALGSAAQLTGNTYLQYLGFLADGRMITVAYDYASDNYSCYAATATGAGATQSTLLAGYGNLSVAPDGAGMFLAATDPASGLYSAFRIVSGAPALELLAVGVSAFQPSPDGERLLSVANAVGPTVPEVLPQAELLIAARAAGGPPMVLLDQVAVATGEQAKPVASRVPTPRDRRPGDRPGLQPFALANPDARLLGRIGGFWLGNQIYFAPRSGSLAPVDFQDGIYEGTLPW